MVGIQLESASLMTLVTSQVIVMKTVPMLKPSMVDQAVPIMKNLVIAQTIVPIALAQLSIRTMN